MGRLTEARKRAGKSTTRSGKKREKSREIQVEEMPAGDEKKPVSMPAPEKKKRVVKEKRPSRSKPSPSPVKKRESVKKPAGKKQDEPVKRDTPVSLPSSGFAEEILAVAKSSQKVHSEDPEQIYRFADQLNSEQNRKADRDVIEQLETWVTFSLDDEVYGLPVSHVREILRTGVITRVPHAPSTIRGITNMRGKVLPVVDLRVRMGLEKEEIHEISKILVCDSRNRWIGLLVDAVQQVIRLEMSKVLPPPPDILSDQSDFLRGVYDLDDSMVFLLDVDRILLIPTSAGKADPLPKSP